MRPERPRRNNKECRDDQCRSRNRKITHQLPMRRYQTAYLLSLPMKSLAHSRPPGYPRCHLQRHPTRHRLAEAQGHGKEVSEDSHQEDLPYHREHEGRHPAPRALEYGLKK
ncbi:unknown [Methanothermobacter thermautotrophicus str. Delta H]|uniref:Uncharacterized protein n=1 Tax=Methanothermobacter thermautotrophicus (strain ATCC 29096 / DSM 1053 / JCM 10044 / NBRC 100330 / Delta H) TaxID=187420 RepID=O26420_METTH|nr:unknown [Methanothermobacter thermautotrophicus str. Delta H]